jgi:anti-sigma regulatory factor (Ser/Thr protein kinase)
MAAKDPQALRHGAFVYESRDAYVDHTVAFLREGLEAGEGAVVGDARGGLAVMREALGADADRVTFCDLGSTYSRPARTLAAYYGLFLGELQKAPSVRAVAEVQLGPTADDFLQWAGYEAMTNMAYSHLPVWVVCTYNANGLPDPVLEAVWRTHPEVLTDGAHASHEFEDPREVVRAVTPEPSPLPDLRSFSVGDDLEAFRELLARELAVEMVPEPKALEVLVAGTEIAANALQHGGGIAQVRVGRAEGRFICEVVDRGNGFDDPLAGYLVPREGSGSGLWIARQLAWRVEFSRSSHGFTVRIVV